MYSCGIPCSDMETVKAGCGGSNHEGWSGRHEGGGGRQAQSLRARGCYEPWYNDSLLCTRSSRQGGPTIPVSELPATPRGHDLTLVVEQALQSGGSDHMQIESSDRWAQTRDQVHSMMLSPGISPEITDAVIGINLSSGGRTGKAPCRSCRTTLRGIILDKFPYRLSYLAHIPPRARNQECRRVYAHRVVSSNKTWRERTTRSFASTTWLTSWTI